MGEEGTPYPHERDSTGWSPYVDGSMVFVVLWFYGFIVLQFYSFIVLWFYCFAVLWFYGFKHLLNFCFMFSGIY